jgi:NitT/TauT family transport system substrate-binding protein
VPAVSGGLKEIGPKIARWVTSGGYILLKICARLGWGVTLSLGLLTTLFGTPRPAAADDTLTVMGASIAPSLYDVLDIVAEHAGFYKTEHLNVVEQLVNSPAIAAQLVGTGKGDLCALSYEAVLQGYEKGLHLQYFFSRSQRYTNEVGVLDDSPVRTLADLKGKNIGVINIGSAGEVTAQLMLEGVGIHPTEVTYSPIGVGAQAYQSILTKKVDAVGYPTGEIVPMEIVANVKFRVFRDPILSDVPNAGYAATPATIQSKADALKRFSRAIVHAAIFTRENPQVAARWFLEASGGKFTDADVQKKALEFVLLRPDLPGLDPMSNRIGALATTGMQIYARDLQQYGMTKDVVPVSAVVTNDYIDFANAFDHKAAIAAAKSYRPAN